MNIICVIMGTYVKNIIKKSLFISTGTKWCGPGNIATSCNDFGLYTETDKCCKSI